MSGPLRVVLDTEIGSDAGEALALALALRSPELELAAVTTVGGDSLLRARIAARLLELAGRSDVPVYPGCRTALLDRSPLRWFGHEGEGLIEPTEEPAVSPLHAVDALRQLLRGPRPLHLVATGPLTNLAAALVLEPGLVSGIASLTLPGVAILGPREASASEPDRQLAATDRLSADPHAAERVLRSGAPIRLIAAEPSLQLGLGPRELAQIGQCGTPLAAALVGAVELWAPLLRQLLKRGGRAPDAEPLVLLGASLALASLHDASLCAFEELEIEVARAEGCFGLAEREQASGATRPMRCARRVDDARRFREQLTARLGRG